MTGTSRHRFCFRAFLLVTILALQGVGWFVAWQIMRWDAQSAARIALANSETPVFTITIALAQFQPLRIDDHEIRWQGKLCDIQSAVYQGDSLRLSLYYDQYEETVLDRLFRFFELEDTDGLRHVRTALAKWLGVVFLMAHPPDLCWATALQMNRSNFLSSLLIAQYAPGRYYPPPK